MTTAIDHWLQQVTPTTAHFKLTDFARSLAVDVIVDKCTYLVANRKNVTDEQDLARCDAEYDRLGEVFEVLTGQGITTMYDHC